MVIGVNVIHQYQLFFDATELRFHGEQSERIPYRIGLVDPICIRNRIYLFRSILLKKCIICLNTNCQSRMAIEKKKKEKRVERYPQELAGRRSP